MGRMIVYLTAWLAMAGYFVALVAPPASSWRRRLWTFAWLVFLTHVAAAFQFVHHWSHVEAATATDRRALELIGRPAPNGIYYNYAFLLVWTFDVAWLWLAPQSYARRPRPIGWLIHGFLLFIVVNATIVFGHGPVRWLFVGALAATAKVVLQRATQRRHDRRIALDEGDGR